jgi:protein SCO1/2
VTRGGLRRTLAAACLTFFSLILPSAATSGAAIDETEAYSKSQGALGKRLGDHRFLDSDARELRLSRFRGKPLLVSMIYTSCYHTCPVITRHLAGVVDVAREALGADSFEVITVGFDTQSDTPERMRSFARGRGISDPRWHFLSADEATIRTLSEDLGFSFAPSPRGFDHLTQVTVIDADGRVFRQVYGDAFTPPALVEPLKALVLGTGAGIAGFTAWVKGVRFLCTVYDPASGRYSFDYSIFIALITGVLSLGGVAIFVIRAWRQHRPPTRSA